MDNKEMYNPEENINEDALDEVSESVGVFKLARAMHTAKNFYNPIYSAPAVSHYLKKRKKAKIRKKINKLEEKIDKKELKERQAKQIQQNKNYYANLKQGVRSTDDPKEVKERLKREKNERKNAKYRKYDDYDESMIINMDNYNSSLDDYSLMYESSMGSYIDNNINNEFIIKESLSSYGVDVIHEQTDLQNNVEQKWVKFMQFNDNIDNRFYAVMNKIIVNQNNYLAKYKDIILNKDGKDTITYEYNGDYIEAVNRCMNTQVPVFNYERDAEWLRQPGYEGALRDFMSGKNIRYDEKKSLSSIFKSWFLATERGKSVGNLANLNLENLYNYCYNWKDIQQNVHRDKEFLEQSRHQFINCVNKVLRDHGENTNETSNVNPERSSIQTPRGNTGKMEHASIYNTHEIDWVSINEDANATSSQLHIDTKTQNVKDANGNTIQQKVKTQGRTNTPQQDLNIIENKWISLCRAFLTAKKTAMQQIARDYMALLKAHINSYNDEVEKINAATQQQQQQNAVNQNNANQQQNQNAQQESYDMLTESSIIDYINGNVDYLGYDNYVTESLSNDALSLFVDNIDKHIILNSLRKVWKENSKDFKYHKWIYKELANDKQCKIISKYIDTMCKDNVSYGQYKKAFKYICKFMDIPYDRSIIELIDIKNQNNSDKKVLAVRYSKGLVKVNIPNDAILIHISPNDNITGLKPTFKSKNKGKYFTPSNRVYFTIMKPFNDRKAGLHGVDTKYVYTPTVKFTSAYIDPMSITFKYGASVYIETDTPISVEKLENDKLHGYYRRKKARLERSKNFETKDADNKTVKKEEN